MRHLMIPITGLALAVALMLGIASHSARSHSWYPIDCCSGIDCAPATVTKVGPNDYLITTRHGQVRTDINWSKVQQSPDAEPHACIYKDMGADKLRCLWLPTGS